MQKETILSLIRSVATLAGSFLAGKIFLGQPVDWTMIVGAVMVLISTIWGIVDKSLSSEALISGLKSVVLTFGGIFVAAGKITGQALDSIMGLVLAIIPILQGFASKATVQAVATGTAVPEVKKGTEPANVPTVYTGKLIKQSPPIADSRAKQDPNA